jgi:SAM-dependent methyltransferase
MELLCPCCRGAAEQRRLYEKNGCDILRCVGCGLGRAVAHDFSPDEYYTAGYFCGAEPDGYADYLGAEPVLRHEFADTAAFIRRYRGGGRLLELGCAYGFFLKEAEPFFQVGGIEIAADAAACCRERGLRVVTGVADTATLAEFGALDVVVLLDVIEHLPDPYATLELCYRQLNPGGVIAITTGDFASPLARLAGRHWRLMTPPQHLWYFTPESLRRLAASLGLRLEAYDHPWKLVPLSLIAFQLRRMLRIAPVSALRTASLHTASIGIPVNLFDAIRCVLRKPNAQSALPLSS